MNQVWVIAKKQNETYGHGDFGTSLKLPRLGPYDTGNFHPYFDTEADATAYIESLQFHYDLVAVPLDKAVIPCNTVNSTNLE